MHKNISPMIIKEPATKRVIYQEIVNIKNIQPNEVILP